jgi:putative oxidoreductase
MFHADHSIPMALGYVLLGAVFITQAVGTLPRARFANHATKLRDKGFPLANVVLACALAMMLAGGSMLILDVYPRIGAAMLIVFTVIATLLYQNFWSIEDPARRREKRGTFFNNLAILGGLLIVVS